MSLSSRLPTELTLDQRAAEINRLFDKINNHDAQTERLRWRVAVELHACQRLVPVGQWEKWCRNNIGRSPRDIQKLLKMAEAHDPEAAHETEKAAQRVARQEQKDSKTVHASLMPPLDEPERSDAARKLIQAVLAEYSISEARSLLRVVDKLDLVEALEAEATSTHGRPVRVVSTATH